MGLLDIASIRSIERGFNYYQSECVINLKSFSETQHETEVKGSGNKVYRCYIDMEHPRKSKCNCPLRRNMWIDSLKEMINDMSEEELRDAYLNMLIEHGEMAELFGLDEEDEFY